LGRGRGEEKGEGRRERGWLRKSGIRDTEGDGRGKRDEEGKGRKWSSHRAPGPGPRAC